MWCEGVVVVIISMGVRLHLHNSARGGAGHAL